MARPRKTGLDYFPFDVDYFSDEKIVAIAGEFGLKGEIASIKLLCAIYRNGYFIEWNEMMAYKILRELPGVSADLLDNIVRRLVRWGFFDESLFDSAHVLTSRGIQRRYFEATKKRLAPAGYPHLLSFRDINPPETPVSASETPVSASEMPQSKGKKRKYKQKISSDEDTKKPVSAAVAPGVLIDETLRALTAPATVEASARLLGLDPAVFTTLARETADRWRVTLEFDRERPRDHMLSTIRLKARAAAASAPDPAPPSKGRGHAAPRRDKSATRDDGPANGIGQYEAYCRMRGLDPSVPAAEQSRRLADDDTPPFLSHGHSAPSPDDTKPLTPNTKRQ